MSTRTPPRKAPRAAMDERMRARRRKVRAEQTRRRRRVTLSVLAVVGLAAVAAVLVRSPLFAITDIRATGVDAIAAAQVVSAAGLHEGENLLFADLGAVEERLRGLAWVRDVRARRVPPSVVTIQVSRREAAAVLRTGAALWLMDPEGVALAGGTRESLPHVQAAAGVVVRIGEPVDDAGVHNALAVHAALPGPLRSLVVRYDAPSPAGLRILLDGADTGGEQVWVRFGSADRAEAKARVIGLLLAEARARPIENVELDVRAPDNPVLVPLP